MKISAKLIILSFLIIITAIAIRTIYQNVDNTGRESPSPEKYRDDEMRSKVEVELSPENNPEFVETKLGLSISKKHMKKDEELPKMVEKEEKQKIEEKTSPIEHSETEQEMSERLKAMKRPEPPVNDSKVIENLSLVVMCKNEEKQIRKTFDSVKGYIKEFFIYDTGSTDRTLIVIKKYCEHNNIKLHLMEGKFINFSVSRNELISFVEKKLEGKQKWLLFMDVSDEMKNMDLLSTYIKTYKGEKSGFFLEQNWKSGDTIYSYFNIRLTKSGKGWKWSSDEVHETIVNEKYDEVEDNRLNNIILFQDRNQSGQSSVNRWKKDKEILYQKYLDNPKDTRTLFYLAQTYQNIGERENAIKFYKLRTKETGYLDEVYNSYMHLGDINRELGRKWEKSMKYYLKAFQFFQRVEPLNILAEHYLYYTFKEENKLEYHTAYMYAITAIQLNYPLDSMLFMSPAEYHYRRWSLLCQAAYHVGRYREGREACIIAIKAENRDIDKDNLKFYIKKELSILLNEPFSFPTAVAITAGIGEYRNEGLNDVIENNAEIILNIAEDVIAANPLFSNVKTLNTFKHYQFELIKYFSQK